MDIQIPCDYKNVNLLTEPDANMFGEALRQYCFVGNCMTTGCYSTFDVIKCLKKVEHGKNFNEAKSQLWKYIKPTVYHFKLKEKDCWMSYDHPDTPKRMKFCEPYEIVLGWAWDGDGSLYIRFNDRAVINNDCKKDYTWEWIK